MACSQTKVDFNVIQMEVEGENATGRFRRKRLNDSHKLAGNWLEHWKDPVHEEDGHNIYSLVGDRGEKTCFRMG